MDTTNNYYSVGAELRRGPSPPAPAAARAHPATTSRCRRRAMSLPPRPGPTAGNHRPAGGASTAAPRRPAAHLLRRAGLSPPELPLGFGGEQPPPATPKP
nr:unnamed protein product [Digitaria exilis]